MTHLQRVQTSAAGLIYYDLDYSVGALRSRLNVLFLQ